MNCNPPQKSYHIVQEKLYISYKLNSLLLFFLRDETLLNKQTIVLTAIHIYKSTLRSLPLGVLEGDPPPSSLSLNAVVSVLNAAQTRRKSGPGVFSRSLPEIKMQIVTFSSLKSPDTWLIRIRKPHAAKSFK